MKKILLIILFLSFSGYAQFQKTDSLGNFYVINKQLIWQKYYYVEDMNELDEKLKREPFTSGLEILNHGNSSIIKGYMLDGINLPTYAKHTYDAFLVIDFFYDKFRVSVKQIHFPDFEEEIIYYNGMTSKTSRGSLDHYILSNFRIKPTTGNKNVLYSFDDAFSQIFDNMATPLSE